MKNFYIKNFLFVKWFVPTVLLICLLTTNLKAQDVHFSQPSYTPLQINPALTGVFDGLARLSNSYRSQWGGIGKGYKTIHFSGDAPLGKGELKNSFFGVGALIYQDAAGTAGFKSTILEGSLSFTTAVDESGNNFFSIGFQAGLNQQSIDPNKATWDSQWNGDSFDPNAPSFDGIQLPSTSYADFNAGVMYYYVPDGSNSFNLGASMSHIGSPNVSFYSNREYALRTKYTFHSSADIDISNDNSVWIEPRALFMMQGTQKEIYFGGYFKNKVKFKSRNTNYMKEAYFMGGLFYRWDDAYIVSARFEYNSVGLGLSYDINSSSLSNLAGGANSFEVNFTYVTYIKRGTRSKNYNKMPRFF